MPKALECFEWRTQMNKGILIAFLGANRPRPDDVKKVAEIEKGLFGYSESGYFDASITSPQGNDTVLSKFTFDYYLTKNDGQTIEIEKVFLVGTVTSSWDEVYRYYALKQNSFDYDIYRDIYEKASSNRLSDNELAESLNPAASYFKKPFIPIIIQSGRTDEEVRESFLIIKDTLVKEASHLFKNDDKDNRIVCDITNGFRSIPIYTYMLSNYLSKVLKWQAQFELFYGMFEDKTFPDKTPVVNLASVDRLLKWVSATNEFQAYGSVKTILELLEKEEYRDLIEVFSQFEYGTSHNNLYYIYHATLRLCKYDYKTITQPEIRLIMEEIATDLREQFADSLALEGTVLEKIAYFQFDLANWFIRQGRIGQATVTMQETMTTLFICLLDNTKSLDEAFHHKNRDAIRSVVCFKNLVFSGDLGQLIKHSKNNIDGQKGTIRNIFSHCVFSERKGDIVDVLDEEKEWLSSFQNLLSKVFKDEKTKNEIRQQLIKKTQTLKVKKGKDGKEDYKVKDFKKWFDIN